jgi:type IV pilus assembly protein PilE
VQCNAPREKDALRLPAESAEGCESLAFALWLRQFAICVYLLLLSIYVFYMPFILKNRPFIQNVLPGVDNPTKMPNKEFLRMKTSRGFTLIELMIVVAIVAILSAIALPAYNQYVTRSKLTDAFSGLSSMSVALQQYYQDNRTYVGAPICTTPPTAKDYQFSCQTLTATAFTLAATPTGNLVAPSYAIDQDGNKYTTSVPASGWIMPPGVNTPPTTPPLPAGTTSNGWARDQSGNT